MEDASVINSHVLDYFSHLFTSNATPRDFSCIKDVIPSLVTEADNIALTSMPYNELIRSVVFAMDPHSVLGPDGYTGHFFRSCWYIVGYDLCNAIRSFFATGSIFGGLNSNLMVLIPKIQGANSVDKFRPIILSNFLFKIITRILAQRLAPIASNIISAN